VARNRAWGATGATSDPLIVTDLIKTGRYDDEIQRLLRDGLNDEDLT
jgi:transaldolase